MGDEFDEAWEEEGGALDDDEMEDDDDDDMPIMRRGATRVGRTQRETDLDWDEDVDDDMEDVDPNQDIGGEIDPPKGASLSLREEDDMRRRKEAYFEDYEVDVENTGRGKRLRTATAQQATYFSTKDGGRKMVKPVSKGYTPYPPYEPKNGVRFPYENRSRQRAIITDLDPNLYYPTQLVLWNALFGQYQNEYDPFSKTRKVYGLYDVKEYNRICHLSWFKVWFRSSYPQGNKTYKKILKNAVSEHHQRRHVISVFPMMFDFFENRGLNSLILPSSHTINTAGRLQHSRSSYPNTMESIMNKAVDLRAIAVMLKVSSSGDKDYYSSHTFMCHKMIRKEENNVIIVSKTWTLFDPFARDTGPLTPEDLAFNDGEWDTVLLSHLSYINKPNVMFGTVIFQPLRDPGNVFEEDLVDDTYNRGAYKHDTQIHTRKQWVRDIGNPMDKDGRIRYEPYTGVLTQDLVSRRERFNMNAKTMKIFKRPGASKRIHTMDFATGKYVMATDDDRKRDTTAQITRNWFFLTQNGIRYAGKYTVLVVNDNEFRFKHNLPEKGDEYTNPFYDASKNKRGPLPHTDTVSTATITIMRHKYPPTFELTMSRVRETFKMIRHDNWSDPKLSRVMGYYETEPVGGYQYTMDIFDNSMRLDDLGGESYMDYRMVSIAYHVNDAEVITALRLQFSRMSQEDAADKKSILKGSHRGGRPLGTYVDKQGVAQNLMEALPFKRLPANMAITIDIPETAKEQPKFLYYERGRTGQEQDDKAFLFKRIMRGNKRPPLRVRTVPPRHYLEPTGKFDFLPRGMCEFCKFFKGKHDDNYGSHNPNYVGPKGQQGCPNDIRTRLSKEAAEKRDDFVAMQDGLREEAGDDDVPQVPEEPDDLAPVHITDTQQVNVVPRAPPDNGRTEDDMVQAGGGGTFEPRQVDRTARAPDGTLRRGGTLRDGTISLYDELLEGDEVGDDDYEYDEEQLEENYDWNDYYQRGDDDTYDPYERPTTRAQAALQPKPILIDEDSASYRLRRNDYMADGVPLAKYQDLDPPPAAVRHTVEVTRKVPADDLQRWDDDDVDDDADDVMQDGVAEESVRFTEETVQMASRDEPYAAGPQPDRISYSTRQGEAPYPDSLDLVLHYADRVQKDNILDYFFQRRRP